MSKKNEFEPQGKRKRVLGVKRKKKKLVRPSHGKLSKKEMESVIDEKENKGKKKAADVLKGLSGKRKYLSDKEIIDALMERGTVAGASRLLGCPYRTISERVKPNSDIRRVLEAKEKSCLSVLYGYAIDNILSLLIQGDFNASKLVLEKKCGWVGALAHADSGNVLNDNEIKSKIENMTQEEREKRILELQEKLMSKKIVNVTPKKGN